MVTSEDWTRHAEDKIDKGIFPKAETPCETQEDEEAENRPGWFSMRQTECGRGHEKAENWLTLACKGLPRSVSGEIFTCKDKRCITKNFRKSAGKTAHQVES